MSLSAQTLFVTNAGDGTIEEFTSTGAASVFGSTASSPFGLAFDTAGNLYVANETSNAIEEFTPDGAALVFASTGLDYPLGLAFDAAGNLYVANFLSNTIVKFTPDGVASQFASAGLNEPAGLAFDTAGNLYVANAGSNNIEKFTPAGAVSVFASTGNNPVGLAFDTAGNLYVSNSLSNTIQKFTPDGTGSVFATIGLNNPQSLAFDTSGNLYVVNLDGNTIEKFTSTGAASMFASTGLNRPSGLAFSTAGTLQLSAATASVAENAGSVTLSVSRANGSSGAVSVNYATADSSAVAGVDYQPVSGTLSWADGDSSSKTITVPIVDRKLTSGDAQFLVNLTQTTGNAVLGTPVQETVTVLETDMAVDNIQSVDLLSPPSGITLTQNVPVTLYASVDALANTLAKVEFYSIDSTNNQTALGGFETASGQINWQLPTVGSFTVEVVATDEQGNMKSATVPIQVVAPNTLGATPQTNLYGGLDGLYLTPGDPLPVIAQAVDSDGNPLQNVQFYLDDGTPVNATPVSTSSSAMMKTGPKAQDASANSLFLASVTVTKAQQLLTAVGKTVAGVSAVSNAANLFSKTGGGTPPSVAISSVANGDTLPAGSTSQSVTVTANPGSQPIGSVELTVDTMSVGVLKQAPYTFSLPSLPAGPHALIAKAKDTSLLSKVSDPVVVEVQQAAPSYATPAFFNGQAALSNGVYYLSFPDGDYFGYYSFLPDPHYIYHFDLGFEYVFDAMEGNAGVYLYDFASSTFFYTSPTFPFPYLYDFTLDSVLYYYPDKTKPGHYTTDPRYFYNFGLQQIITK